MNNNISLLQNQLKHTLGQLELSALPGKGELDKLKKIFLFVIGNYAVSNKIRRLTRYLKKTGNSKNTVMYYPMNVLPLSRLDWILVEAFTTDRMH